MDARVLLPLQWSVRFVLVSLVVTLAGCGFHVGSADGVDAPNALDDGSVSDSADGAPPDIASDALAIVQQVTGAAPNTNAPLSATLGSPPASGHLLVMVGAAEHGGLASVTGGGVGTWTRATNSLSNSNIEIWYGVTNGSSATVTITFPAYGLPIWMAVSEWSGLTTTSVLDVTGSTSGGASPAGPGTIATTHAHDLLIFAVTDSTPNTFGAPTPGAWTAMTGVTAAPVVQAAWYREVTATGSYAPTVTETAHSWDSAAAAFRVAP